MVSSISSHNRGGDIKTILHLHRILIRSKLGYECIVYQSASKTTKSLLEPMANECIRMVTRAFKSTPVKSLNIIANETSLEDRRQRLSVKYYYKIKSQLNNPEFEGTIIPSSELLFQHKQLLTTFAIRTRNLIH